MKRKPGQNLWTPKRVSRYLDVSVNSVYAWAADGTIPAILVTEGPRKRTWRFDPAEIEEWARSRSTWKKRNKPIILDTSHRRQMGSWNQKAS